MLAAHPELSAWEEGPDEAEDEVVVRGVGVLASPMVLSTPPSWEDDGIEA